MDTKKDLNLSLGIAFQNWLPYLSSVLNPFLSTHPEWELIFYSAIGLYGVYMNCNQEDVNDIVRFIGEHPDKFREEIIRSDEFKKGFLIYTEQYLKQRIKEKKLLLNKIILDYTTSGDKGKYELERLNDILIRISPESLEFLKFYTETIFPEIDRQIKEELLKDSYRNSDRSIDWWYERLVDSKPIWEFIDKWVYDNFNQNSHKVKTQYQMLNSGWPPDLQRKIENLEKAKRDSFTECISELVSLGVLRMRVTGGTIGSSSGSEYSFTSFGRKFLKISFNH